MVLPVSVGLLLELALSLLLELALLSDEVLLEVAAASAAGVSADVEVDASAEVSVLAVLAQAPSDRIADTHVARDNRRREVVIAGLSGVSGGWDGVRHLPGHGKPAPRTEPVDGGCVADQPPLFALSLPLADT